MQLVPQKRVQNRTLEKINDEPVPSVMEAAVEVMRPTPEECAVNRTPEQLVDEPVPQIAEEIVGPVPFGRIPLPSQRELHEVLRRLYEQYAFEEDEEEEEDEAEYNDEEEISRFPPHWHPRRWCRFVVEGACCPHGSR